MPHKSEHFTNEKHIFSNLGGEEGMIRYIGWFQSFEPVENAGMQEYYNIVLELAEFDFYEAILQESPPISFDEIQGFWESMSEISRTLASIHTVEVERDKYLTCVRGMIFSPRDELTVGCLDGTATSSLRTYCGSTGSSNWQTPERLV